MNDEQEQIEEMAKQMCGAIDNSCIHDCTPACGAREYAKRCFKAGYRKQGDTVRECLRILRDISPPGIVEPFWVGWSEAINAAIREISEKYAVSMEVEQK